MKKRKRSEARATPQLPEEMPAREWTIETPNDPVNEQVILAAMMVDTEVCDRFLTMFPTEAFYAEPHRIVREALAEMRRRKLLFDPATLARISPNVDMRLIEQLPASRPEVPNETNLQHHVDTLLWDWRRAIVARGPYATFTEDLQDPNAPPEKLRAVARQMLEALEGEQGRGKHLRDPKEVVRQMMDRLRSRAEGEAYFPFGIDGIDYYEDGTRRLRPGASPGTMTLVTALSGSGKSTLMGHLALSLARQKRRVLFGAWEEAAPVTLEMITTMSLGWSRSRVLDGKSNQLRQDDGEWAPMTQDDLVSFEERAHAISKWVTFFDNPFQRNDLRIGKRPTNDDHLDIIHQHIEDAAADVFFADLLQRSFVETSPDDERHALYRLLAISEECRVHTIAAHQQRAKDIEARANKMPTREGIIGSGAWLDTFWSVIAPHLPAKWKAVPDTVMQLIILKQRNGPWPLGIEMQWDPDTGQISGGESFDVKASADSSDPAFGPKTVQEKKKKNFFGGRR